MDTELVNAIPYMRFMGITMSVDGDGVLGLMRYGEHLVGNPRLPALHGGTLGALLESTSLVQLIHELDTVGLPKTINITVDYLRSGRPVDTFARAHITKLGRRVVNVRAVAWQDDRDKPICVTNGHFMVKTEG